MAYTFFLEDLAGNIRSELPGATAKQFTRSILSMGTATVKVPLWNDQADFMLDGDALLKVVDVVGSSRVNMFHGRLIAADEVGDENGGSVQATFADGFWPMMRRLCGKSTTGYSAGTAAVPVSASSIYTDLINTTNTASPSGLRLGTVTTTPSIVYTGPHYYKKIGEVIAQISGVLDGPDWRVEPIDAVASTNPNTCYYSELTVAPVIGQTRLDHPFEFGDGRLNVKSYKRGVSLDGSANRVFTLPSGFPTSALGVRSASDAGSQSARGLLEDVVQSDLTADAMRQALVNHHIAVRAGARQTITFDPVNDLSGERLPRLRTDYDVGDVVPFRISLPRKNAAGQYELDRRFNALVRIYGVQMTVDEKGVGQPTLTVTPS